MAMIGKATGVFWVLALGAIALFLFFAATGLLAPGEVAWLTVAMAVLAMLSLVHFVRVRHHLESDTQSELARKVHAMREHRGF